jgi:RecB family endonuclease NucS
MRLIVARCSVEDSGHLSARLPEALRLVMLKADGSVLVHGGGSRPTAPRRLSPRRSGAS